MCIFLRATGRSLRWFALAIITAATVDSYYAGPHSAMDGSAYGKAQAEIAAYRSVAEQHYRNPMDTIDIKPQHQSPPGHAPHSQYGSYPPPPQLSQQHHPSHTQQQAMSPPSHQTHVQGPPEPWYVSR